MGLKICEQCNKEYPEKKFKTRFCGMSCSKTGKNNPRYGKPPWNKGDGMKVRSGSRNVTYRYITVNREKMYEHRYIMEQHLGRKLRDDEVVHHIDGDGLNNDISNLQLMKRGEHSRMHADVAFLRGGGAL